MVLPLEAALSSVSERRLALNGRFIESFGGAVGHQLFGGVLAMAPLGIEAARSKGPGGGGGAGGHCSSMCSSRDGPRCRVDELMRASGVNWLLMPLDPNS